MIHDPDFVAQTAELMTRDERRAWFDVRAAEFRDRGATWMQASVDDAENPKVTLLEGWLVQPKEQPAPHFQMQPTWEACTKCHDTGMRVVRLVASGPTHQRHGREICDCKQGRIIKGMPMAEGDPAEGPEAA